MGGRGQPQGCREQRRRIHPIRHLEGRAPDQLRYSPWVERPKGAILGSRWGLNEMPMRSFKAYPSHEDQLDWDRDGAE